MSSNSYIALFIETSQYLPSSHSVCHYHHQEWGQPQDLLSDLGYATQPLSKYNGHVSYQEDIPDCLSAGLGT